MKRLLIAICILMVLPIVVHAEDVEIYGTTTSEIKPNVLIIFDNSGSMNDEVQSALGYDPAITYTQALACGGGSNVLCETTRVYRWRGVEKIWQAHTTIAKRVVSELVQTTDEVNFGLMVFNQSQGGRLAFPVSDMTTGTNRTDLVNIINALNGETWTPLAETHYEAMRYYSGQSR